MRIGVGLWCLQSTATAPRAFTAAYDELLDDARLAERVGIDSLWLSEHHRYYDGYCPALLPAASAALAVTERLRVGTGVLLLPLHRPERVAAGARELTRRSGGRFELGMGMGYRPTEFEARGLSMDDRVARMNAGLDVLSSDPPAPLWVGVTSEAAARRAGRRGLGLFISGAFSAAVVDSLVSAHRRAWEDAGRPRTDEPPPVGVLRNLWLADTAAERRQALDWVRSSYLVYAGLGWGALSTGVDFVSEIELSMDEVEASARVGSPGPGRRAPGRLRRRPGGLPGRLRPAAAVGPPGGGRANRDRADPAARIGGGTVRIGVDLRTEPDPRRRRHRAIEADRLGLWAVLLDGLDGTGTVEAAALATETEHLHLAVVLDGHPVAVAEEIAVLDHLSRRRAIAVVEGTADEVEHVERLLAGHVVDGVALTPPPAQMRVPVLAAADVEPIALSGDLDQDRATIDRHLDAGSTHRFVTWPGPTAVLARHLATRAAGPDFPDVVAELADVVDPPPATPA